MFPGINAYPLLQVLTYPVHCARALRPGTITFLNEFTFVVTTISYSQAGYLSNNTYKGLCIVNFTKTQLNGKLPLFLNEFFIPGATRWGSASGSGMMQNNEEDAKQRRRRARPKGFTCHQ